MSKITKEKIEKIEPVTGPLNKLAIAKYFKMTLKEYAEWRADVENEELVEELDYKILHEFYKYSFNNKVAKGIDLYMENEIPKTNTGIKLQIINDITEYQSQLQPFDMNNKRVDIENPRDKIIIIPDTTDGLVELIEESEDA